MCQCRRKFINKLLNTLFLLLLLLSPAITTADSALAKQVDLKTVNTQITKTQHHLSTQQSYREQLERQLKAAEILSAGLTQALEQSTAQLQQHKIKLSRLQQQQNDYLEKLATENSQLNRQIRAAFMLNREPYIKVILNQEDPRTINRMLQYYHYLDRARMSLMQQLQQTLHVLRVNQLAVRQQTQQLQRLLQQQQQQQSRLQQTNLQRQQIIVLLNRQISAEQQHLGKLLIEREALTTVINHLLTATLAMPVQALPSTVLPIARMKGNLAWPTSGRLVSSYAATTNRSDVTANAVVVAAPQGQPVYAIYTGRVVFADWLRGFGLLLIVDHGQGYMSVYGRNESLYHKTGDYVQTGDLIARVGASGGYEESGLYFSIRHDGKPIDPAQWCRRIGTSKP